MHDQKKSRRKRHNRKRFSLIGGLFLLLFAGIIGAFVLSQNLSQKAEKNSSSSHPISSKATRTMLSTTIQSNRKGNPPPISKGLTLEQEIGQVLMVANPAAYVSNEVLNEIATYHVGNVYLSGRSYNGTLSTQKITSTLQAQATQNATGRKKLLIATDQEGGYVQVLAGNGFSKIPTGLMQGTWGVSTLKNSAILWGEQLSQAGLNMNLAPVVDTVASAQVAANNAPIGYFQREFGYSQSVIASHAITFFQGMSDAKILTTAKHFPGLGYVNQNTDFSGNVHDTTTTESSESVATFRQVIDAGIPVVMMSSAYYDRIDPKNPACFSSIIVMDLLRKQLGFKGIVITDSLGSAQLSVWSAGERAVLGIEAGDDILLTSQANDIPAMYQAIYNKAKSDTAFAEKVVEAAHLVLSYK